MSVHSRLRDLLILTCFLTVAPVAALAQGTITGVVTAGSNPVANARVTLNTPLRFYETRTLADGSYAINNVRVGAGQQRLGVAAPGYDALFQDRLVGEGLELVKQSRSEGVKEP